MSTKVLMDVEEYLQTSFDGPDCEYLDGEVVERNTGEIPHGDVQEKDPAGAVCDVLRTEEPNIEIPLQAAFDLDS